MKINGLKKIIKKLLKISCYNFTLRSFLCFLCVEISLTRDFEISNKKIFRFDYIFLHSALPLGTNKV